MRNHNQNTEKYRKYRTTHTPANERQGGQRIKNEYTFSKINRKKSVILRRKKVCGIQGSR